MFGIVGIEDADSIDCRARLLDEPHYLFVVVRAAIVAAVTDHHQGLLVASPGLQMLEPTDDENLILRITGFDKRHAGRDQAGVPGPHTAAVVHHQADGDRLVGDCKMADFLRHAIFVDLKLFLGEPRDVAAIRVFDADVEQHQLDVGSARRRRA